MQNNIFSKINVLHRIIILLLLIVSIFVTNSLYLIIAFSIFVMIVAILTNKSVKFYIHLIKNVKLWLLFIFITYIIVFRSILGAFAFLYKVILVILIIKQFSLTVNFNSLASAIKTVFKPVKKIFNIDKISYNIAIFIYFINTYMKSKEEIFARYNLDNKIMYKFSLKYNIFPRVFLTMSKTNEFESSLKLKFYKIRFEPKNKVSNIVLFSFVILFMVVIFKEVIL